MKTDVTKTARLSCCCECFSLQIIEHHGKIVKFVSQKERDHFLMASDLCVPR